MPERSPQDRGGVEMAKKLPTLFAIVALGWALLVSLTHGIDAAFRLTLAGAIAGLGGFYLREFLNRKAPL